MNAIRPTVVLVGAVPPPAVGPYLAMQRLLASPALHGAVDVHFFDISDHRDTKNIGRFDLHNVRLALLAACRFLTVLIRRRPKAIYVGVSQGLWGYLRDLTFLLPAALLRKPIVIHLRGSEFHTFHAEMPLPLQWVTRWLFRRVTTCIVLGSNLRVVMEKLMPPERIVVVPNGIDPLPFTPPGPRPNNSKRILFLAHLMRRKGTHETARAFAKILQSHPDATLTFAGGFWNDTDRDELTALVADLGIASRTTFLGVVGMDAKIEALKSHDLFLFPPILPEGLPWVILEAMSAALPVVTTAQGAIPEVVEHGASGYVVEPEPEALAAKISQLLADPTLRHAMGQRGRQRIDEHFSEAVYVRRITAVLTESCRLH